MKVGVRKLPMNSPNEGSALERLIDHREVDPAEIVTVIGQRGDGGARDFTRGFATLLFGGAREATRHFSGRSLEAHRVSLVRRYGRRAHLSRHSGLRRIIQELSAPPRYPREIGGSFSRRTNSTQLTNSYTCQRGHP